MKTLNLGKLRKVAALAVAAVALAIYAGCSNSEPTSPSAGTGANAVLGVRVALPGTGGLSKSATISLNKLIIVLTSNAGDTIRDTATTSTSPSIAASVASNQTFSKYYSLKPLRTWKMVAKTLDANSIVIHHDSASYATPIRAGDTTVLPLSLNSKYVMYQARFSLPDSIGSSDPLVTAKQKINFDRLVLQIDGVNVKDSTQTYFPVKPSKPTLSYDYVPVGSRTIKMLAYGNLGSGPSILLYKDSTVINPSNDTTTTRTMVYVGPNGNTAVGQASVTIGKVLTVILDGEPDANPFPKTSARP
jgi:hypothetical protein